MILVRPIVSLCLTAIPAVLHGQSAQRADHPLQGTSFTLQLPPDLEGKNESPQMMDFNIYWVYSGGQRLFGIYEGNAPDLGKEHREGKGMKKIHLGHIKGKVSRTKSGEGTCSAQYLIQTKFEEWPSLLHIWYKNQPESEAKTIEAILQTLQLTNPKH